MQTKKRKTQNTQHKTKQKNKTQKHKKLYKHVNMKNPTT